VKIFSLVVHEYVWYPDRLGARVDGFDAAILGRIPPEKRIVPFLSEERQVYVLNHSEIQICFSSLYSIRQVRLSRYFLKLIVLAKEIVTVTVKIIISIDLYGFISTFSQQL